MLVIFNIRKNSFSSYLVHAEALFSCILTLSVHEQGRFYFGELLDDDEGCDDETSAVLNTLHL